MVDAVLEHPEIQDALMRDPDLPLVTSLEGLSLNQLRDQAIRAATMLNWGRAILGGLPEESIAAAIGHPEVPKSERETLLSHVNQVDPVNLGRIVAISCGFDAEHEITTVQGVGEADETPLQKAQRLSSPEHRMTDNERARADAIVAAHRAGRTALAA